MKINPIKIEGPLHPHQKEYLGLLRFLSRSYGFKDPLWFEKDASQFFSRETDSLKNKWVLKINGQFAAHVGLFPFTASIEGRKLAVAGIGAVATHPDHRGQGLMKRLMDSVSREICAKDYPLSILWGDRGLYEQYGYAQAMFLDQFTFQKRILKNYAAPRKIRPAIPSDLSSIFRIYSFHPFHTVRNIRSTHAILKKFKNKDLEPAWVLEEKGKVAAYSVFCRSKTGGSEIAEWGGASEDVVRLWADLLNRNSESELSVSLYPGSDLYGWALENNSHQTRMTQSCMIKILDLFKVLKTFEPQLQRNYRSMGSRTRKILTIRLEDGQAVSLVLGTDLKVASRVGGRPITLSHSDAVRLFFGAGKPRREIACLANDTGILDVLFPLTWYWWRTDWI